MQGLGVMVMLLLKQAVAALTKYIQQSIAPKVQSGRELLEQFQRTRLLPTGCRRSATYLQSQLMMLPDCLRCTSAASLLLLPQHL